MEYSIKSILVITAIAAVLFGVVAAVGWNPIILVGVMPITAVYSLSIHQFIKTQSRLENNVARKGVEVACGLLWIVVPFCVLAALIANAR